LNFANYFDCDDFLLAGQSAMVGIALPRIEQRIELFATSRGLFLVNFLLGSQQVIV